MPLTEDRIDELKKAWNFSVIDLKNGFFHVPMAEQNRKYTAFVTPEEQCEFLETPFGLLISPTSFLRFIDEIFKDLVWCKVVFTYVDGIIIPGENDEQAIKNILEMLKVAEENGLIINWDKCKFFKRE